MVSHNTYLAYPETTNIEAGAAACGRGPDPHRRQEGGGSLVRDLAVGQRLLQFGDARVGDPGAPEGELLQVGQSLKMQQARDRAGRKRPVWSP